MNTERQIRALENRRKQLLTSIAAHEYHLARETITAINEMREEHLFADRAALLGVLSKLGELNNN